MQTDTNEAREFAKVLLAERFKSRSPCPDDRALFKSWARDALELAAVFFKCVEEDIAGASIQNAD